MHCGRYIAAPLSRREMLARCAGGFGGMALAALSADPAYGLTTADSARVFEVHPEISFWAMASSGSNEYSKHTKRGKDERREILMDVFGSDVVETCTAHADSVHRGAG